MTSSQINPVIEKREVQGTTVLYFTFKGKLTENDAKTGIHHWGLFLKPGSEPYHHIWNCIEMTGYEPMARVHWQNGLKEFKEKINRIWLISDKPVIIAGAKILSLFTSLDIKAVKSEELLSI
jgi:hypothetical protein